MQISAGGDHTCALKTDGKVLCWGGNGSNQLGNPNVTATQANPTPTAVINLGTDTKQISAGTDHTCALKTNGKVVCWGFNGFGQLGRPNVTGSQANPTPDFVIGLGTDTLHISAGTNHTCALKTDGKMLCWGDNRAGELGNPNMVMGSAQNATPTLVVGLDGMNTQLISAGGGHTCALKTDGKVLCWGSNGFGQLGAPGNPPAFVDLSIKPEPTPVLGGSIFWK
jgi:alpha-tubulin suppressor-like RCC1 family protein